MLLNRHNLAIAAFSSKEQSRYTLACLSVSPEAGTTATDGTHLISVTLPGMDEANFPSVPGFTPTNGQTSPFLLDRDSAIAIHKAMPKKERIPVLNHVAVGQGTEGALALAINDLERPQVFTPKKVEGQYPNVQAVIPKAEPVFTIHMDADRLGKLCKAIADFRDSRVNTVKLSFYGPENAMRFDAHNADTGQDLFALLMPVKPE